MTKSGRGGVGIWVGFSVLITLLVGAMFVMILLSDGSLPVAIRPHPPLPARTPTSTSAPMPSPTPTPRVEPADSPLPRLHFAGLQCPTFKPRRTTVPKNELEGYLNQVLDCLMLVHREAFIEAGLPLPRPKLLPDSAMGTSRCITDHTEADWAGLYCGADETIYFRTDWSPDEPVLYIDVMAHEFGHHLQEMAGVLQPVNEDQVASKKEPNGAIRSQELSRRVELQAECIAGVLTRPKGPLGIRQVDFDTLMWARSSVPPEWAATHGTGRAQRRWLQIGADSPGPDFYGRCNTFTAPADQVE